VNKLAAVQGNPTSPGGPKRRVEKVKVKKPALLVSVDYEDALFQQELRKQTTQATYRSQQKLDTMGTGLFFRMPPRFEHVEIFYACSSEFDGALATAIEQERELAAARSVIYLFFFSFLSFLLSHD